MSTYMLSTSDNPFNPFTHWDEWYQWDAEAGYNTPSYLDRVTMTSDELTQHDNVKDIVDAIDEIVSVNLTGTYIKVSSDT